MIGVLLQSRSRCPVLDLAKTLAMPVLTEQVKRWAWAAGRHMNPCDVKQ
jgi:hypothetical protein